MDSGRGPGEGGKPGPMPNTRYRQNGVIVGEQTMTIVSHLHYIIIYHRIWRRICQVGKMKKILEIYDSKNRTKKKNKIRVPANDSWF